MNSGCSSSGQEAVTGPAVACLPWGTHVRSICTHMLHVKQTDDSCCCHNSCSACKLNNLRAKMLCMQYSTSCCSCCLWAYTERDRMHLPWFYRT
jgi:hypothetical protein